MMRSHGPWLGWWRYVDGKDLWGSFSSYSPKGCRLPLGEIDFCQVSCGLLTVYSIKNG